MVGQMARRRPLLEYFSSLANFYSTKLIQHHYSFHDTQCEVLILIASLNNRLERTPERTGCLVEEELGEVAFDQFGRCLAGRMREVGCGVSTQADTEAQLLLIICWIPYCLDSGLTDYGDIVSLTQRPRFNLQTNYFSASGTHFCYRLSTPRGLMRLEVLGKLTVGDPPRWPRDTSWSIWVGTKFLRQVAVTRYSSLAD
jgi:hypothetical protein